MISGNISPARRFKMDSGYGWAEVTVFPAHRKLQQPAQANQEFTVRRVSRGLGTSPPAVWERLPGSMPAATCGFLAGLVANSRFTPALMGLKPTSMTYGNSIPLPINGRGSAVAV